MMIKPWRRSLAVLCCLVGISAASWAQTWTVNFKDTDIQEVVRFVAEATGKTIVVDPALKGPVQVMSREPVDRAQLWTLFLSVLEANDLAAVESAGIVRILPLKDARTAPVPVRDGAASGHGRRSDNAEIVTAVIQLRNISAAKLIPVLRPLAPQQAHMAAYGPSNAIIMADTAANIARIRDVIDRIDKAAVEETQIIKLRHASAEETVRMLTQLQQVRQTQAPGEGKSIMLVADKRTNSVLVSADEMERRRIAGLLAHLDSPLQQSGNVQVVYLRYATARDVATVLGKVVQNIEQMAVAGDQVKAATRAEASVEADEGTNSLIVTADADVMTSLLAVVERLDIRRAQVLVEAIIVELSDSSSRDLGIQWLFLDESGAYGASNSGGTLQRNLALGALGQGGANNDAGFIGALTGTPGQLLGVGRANGGFTFNAVINALQSTDDANILSTPSLLTLDNEEAEIVVGQNVPFVTGSYSSTGGGSAPDSPFQTIERQDVGVTLRVTPHVNEGDSLVLNIEQEVSSLFGASSDVDASDIITNQRRIKTKVMVDDGQMIVLGGLMQDDVQQGVQKVPLLGDIPLLGRLFRSDTTSKKKTHLMVFLRPTIIRDSRSLSGATADKYQYIREQQLGRRGDDQEFLKAGDLPLLPEWELELEQLRKVQARNAAQREGRTLPDAAPDAAPGGQ